MTRIIIDCDPGIDDALALLFALAAPELDVLAVTTVSGNRPVERTFPNARDLLALAGREEVPVYRGAYAPLDGAAPRSNLVHGEDGLGGIDLPQSSAVRETTAAALAILSLLADNPEGTITLVPIGPLTNLALARALDPETFRRAGRIAMMGGAVEVPGNVTPAAEFNFWADPVAADNVLQSGVTIDLFGLDVTSQAVCTPEWLDVVSALPGEASKVLSRMIAQYFREDPLLHDPCPIAWLLDPTLFRSEDMHVRVDTGVGPSVGNTLGWRPDRADCPGAVNARVHTTLDNAGLLDLMLKTLGGGS